MSDVFCDPEGDVFFTTCDKTVFQVSRRFLSFASDGLAGLFVVGDPSHMHEGARDNPIVLDIHWKTFDAILRFIYPVEKPNLQNDVPLLGSCIYFADKWVMRGVLDMLRKLLVHPTALKKDPFRAYFFACRFGLDGERRRAECATLRHEIGSLAAMEEMDLISGRDYHNLVQFHYRKRQAAMRLISGLTMDQYDIHADQQIWWDSCRCKCNSNVLWLTPEDPEDMDWNPPLWLRKFVQSTKDSVGACFTQDNIDWAFKTHLLMHYATSTGCPGCPKNMEMLGHRIEKLKMDLHALFQCD